MKRTVLLLLCLAAALPAPAAAQALPDLKNQAAWKEKDKQDFLKFLKSGQPAPANGQQVKAVGASPDKNWSPRKAKYLTLDLGSESLVTVDGAGKSHTSPPSFSTGLLFGGHVFSWVRYYGGLKFSRPKYDKINGSASRHTHYEIPLGVELALIPLGTPHTRYVLLRGGVSAHYFKTGAPKTAFDPALGGWHEAWNLGLGYEWQFPETSWRAHVLAEACRSFEKDNSPEFYRAGVTAGVAYTF